MQKSQSIAAYTSTYVLKCGDKVRIGPRRSRNMTLKINTDIVCHLSQSNLEFTKGTVELCHTKTCLTRSLSMPYKKRLGWQQFSHALFGRSSKIVFLSIIPKEGLAELLPSFSTLNSERKHTLCFATSAYTCTQTLGSVGQMGCWNHLEFFHTLGSVWSRTPMGYPHNLPV